LTRIVFLTESFHPVLGGGERHIRELSAALVAAGMEATVVTRRSEGHLPVEETLDGVKVRRVPPAGPGRLGKYQMVPWAGWALHRLRRRYDVLVVRGSRVLGLPGLLLGRAHGARVVIQPEVNGELSGEVYTWGTGLERSAVGSAVRLATRVRNLWMRDADAFVAMSRRIHQEMRDCGIAPERIHLIPHGVDLRRFEPIEASGRPELRRRLGLGADDLILVYTGRLLRGKGLDILLDAFEANLSRHPDLHLVLVGSGRGQSLSVEEDLVGRSRQEALRGRVTLTGRVENVEDYLQAADLFVFPSSFEALGLSLVEAAACGLPCIGARTGGIVDVIDEGGSGLLFTPGETSELAAAIGRLVEDAPQRRAMGRSGRVLAASRFDAVASRDRYLSLFAELTPRRRPPSSCSAGCAPRGGAAPPRAPVSPA
jgi:glycosyltransferase involved in cell wall biosynthesis